MGPWIGFGEAGEEAGGGDAACGHAADVGHVGEVRFELFLVGVVERHAPCGVALGGACGVQFVGECVVVGKQSAVVVAEGDDAGAGEGGHVDDGGGFVAFCVGEGVAEDEAAFGVGVEDFDGEAGHGGDDVAGFGGVACGHVFAGGDEADDVDFWLGFTEGFKCAEQRCRATHVVFHFVHACAGFE